MSETPGPRDTGDVAEVPTEQRLDVDDPGDYAPEDLSDVEDGEVLYAPEVVDLEEPSEVDD